MRWSKKACSLCINSLVLAEYCWFINASSRTCERCCEQRQVVFQLANDGVISADERSGRRSCDSGASPLAVLCAVQFHRF
jgi:hypothetical protein